LEVASIAQHHRPRVHSHLVELAYKLSTIMQKVANQRNWLGIALTKIDVDIKIISNVPLALLIAIPLLRNTPCLVREAVLLRGDY